jgi:mRNA interferase MazF
LWYPRGSCKVGAIDAQSHVTVPHAKLIRKLGELTTDQVATVEDAVRRWLGL